MGVSRRAVGIFVLAGCMIAIFSFFLIRFFGPVKFSDADIGGVALLLVAYLPLLAVLLVWFLYSPSPVARIYKFARSPRIPSGSIALPFFWLMSLIYLLVVYFDLIVVRDVFATGVTEARYAAIDQGSRESFYGAISLLMSAAPVVLFGMYLSRHVCGVKVSGEKKALLGLVLILTGLSYVGSGGRNAVALSLVYLFFVYLLSKSVARNHSGFPRKLKVFDSKAVFYFSTLTLVLFSFIVYWVFISRAELQYGSIENALAAFMESYNVSMRYSLDMGGLFENAEYFVFMLAWYIAHPLGFLGEQIDNMACVPAYGAATFFGFFRIVDFLFSSSFSSGLSSSLYTEGAYLSLPGSLYVDFCWFGIIFWYIILILSLMALNSAVKKGGDLVFFAAFMCVVLFFAPFFSSFSNGNGFSLFLMSVTPLLIRYVQGAPPKI